MAVKFALGLLMMLVITASMFAVSMGNKNWSSGFNYTDWWSRFGNHHNHNNKTQEQQPKQILVGGSEHWHFGYNYSDWVIKSAPFYLNDTLVFKFDAPNASTFPHSVYMFNDFYSFMKCDTKRAKILANPTQGRGEGFKFVLKKWQPYFFGCGERNGFHCNNGMMKFVVMPMLRPFWSWP